MRYTLGIIYHKPGPRPKKKRVKREGKERRELRRRLSVRGNNHCETCQRYAPFEDTYGDFDMILCGHTSHVGKSAGAGGDDNMKNCKYECFWCHDARHRGKLNA